MKIAKLVQGHTLFKEEYFDKNETRLKKLVENGQNPKALFIGCSDSRFVPDLITDSEPGDLFTIRNVGNLVPPFKPNDDYHGVATGIEYAVGVLDIDDIIVCGHSHCGACEAMYMGEELKNSELNHTLNWLKINDNVKYDIEQNYTFSTNEEKLRMTEQLSIIHQLENLMTYPIVRKKVEDKKLKLHGWYYRLESGELENYDYSLNKFVKINL